MSSKFVLLVEGSEKNIVANCNLLTMTGHYYFQRTQDAHRRRHQRKRTKILNNVLLR